MGKIQRAIISLSDKTGILDFARELQSFGVEILSTGGNGQDPPREGVSRSRIFRNIPGFPEMLDGRVKTLHPKVHGGLLGIRDNPAHARR